MITIIILTVIIIMIAIIISIVIIMRIVIIHMITYHPYCYYPDDHCCYPYDHHYHPYCYYPDDRSYRHPLSPRARGRWYESDSGGSTDSLIDEACHVTSTPLDLSGSMLPERVFAMWLWCYDGGGSVVLCF